MNFKPYFYIFTGNKADNQLIKNEKIDFQNDT